MHHDTAAGNDVPGTGRTQALRLARHCAPLPMVAGVAGVAGQRCTLAGNLHYRIKAA